MSLFAKEAGFFSDLRCSSGKVLSKTKSVNPHFFFFFFFAFLTSLTHHLSMVKFAEKQINVRKFCAKVLNRFNSVQRQTILLVSVERFRGQWDKETYDIPKASISPYGRLSA